MNTADISPLEIEQLCMAVVDGCKDPLVVKAIAALVSSIETIDFEAEPRIWFEGAWLPLHDHQREVWISEWRIIGVFAGWQSGKTTIGPYWLRREIKRRGAGDYAVIAPHNPMLVNKALPELKALFHEPFWTFTEDDGFEMTRVGELAFFGAPQVVTTRILCRHAQNVDSIEAFTAKGIWVEEGGQMKETIWTSIQARGIVHQARILITSRPYRHNWYVREVWNVCMECLGDPDTDPWHRRADAPADMGVINFSTRDNPTPGNNTAYEDAKGKLPAWQHRLKYDGIPTRPVGLVYGSFRPVAREGKPASVISFKEFFPGGLPHEWPVWVGVDFGKIHTSLVLLAEEMRQNHVGDWVSLPSPRFCVFKAYQSSEPRTAAQHLAEAMRGLGKEYTHVNADGTEEEGFRVTRGQVYAFGGSSQESGWRESYARWGLHIAEPLLGGAGSIGAQILTVYSALETGRLVVCDHLVDLINDFGDFSVKLDPETDEPTEQLDNEAKYHRLAALRYVVPSLPLDFEQAQVSRDEDGSFSVSALPTAPMQGVPAGTLSVFGNPEEEDDIPIHWPESRNYEVIR